ncbi:MAG: hypothetical protein JO332_06575 [Planctomycetaceae bacterium]|nr:hypothetical protein [Planctomycetaceae bacterium]
MHPFMLAVGLGLLVGPQDDSRKVLEDFKAKMKEAKSLHEKALALRALGDVEPRDAGTATAIAKYLAPGSGDLTYLLPVTAADALGKFRGCAAASKALVASLSAYKKIPYVSSRIQSAIGHVGHESALALFEEALHGADADAAAAAVGAISNFPAPMAFDLLIREYDAMEKKRGSAGDEAKKVYDRAQKEMVRVLQALSGEKYPTMKELAYWWQKHAATFKDEASRREKPTSAPSTGPLPAVLLVELLFKETQGQTTFNSGASGGAYPLASLAGSKWTSSAALNGGPSALEWDKAGNTAGVDLGGGAGVEPLKQLKSFTIAGWLLCQEAKEGPATREAGAGNRILSWLAPGRAGDGVELVWRADGSLQLGLNQPADASSARSGSNLIPVQDLKAKDQGTASLNAWRFFAVTYDAGIASGHVKFYAGGWQSDVAFVSAHDCNRGAAGPKIAPTLSIGNVPALLRPVAPDREFRGVIDEIRIFGSTMDGSGALSLPELLRIQNRQTGT